MAAAPQQFGPYELLERISVGGMAEVFRARMARGERFSKILGIKRILPSLSRDQKFVSMFIEEARLMAHLTHGNIAQVFDFGMIEGAYYLAMEFVDGLDLRAIQERFLRRGERVPVAVAAHIVLGVCEALAYAHGRKDGNGRSLGIVHRDVSPQNVIVSFAGEVKLVDFGIAKVRDRAKETTHGKVRGKCGYMAPEQILGRPVDHRADLFGLGAVLHELLTGKHLFLAANQVTTIQRLLKAPVEKPSAVNPEVPAALDAIALKALARDPSQRYQSAEQVHAELAAYCRSAGGGLISNDLAQWMQRCFPDGRNDDGMSATRPPAPARPASPVARLAAPLPVRGGAASPERPAGATRVGRPQRAASALAASSAPEDGDDEQTFVSGGPTMVESFAHLLARPEVAAAGEERGAPVAPSRLASAEHRILSDEEPTPFAPLDGHGEDWSGLNATDHDDPLGQETGVRTFARVPIAPLAELEELTPATASIEESTPITAPVKATTVPPSLSAPTFARPAPPEPRDAVGASSGVLIQPGANGLVIHTELDEEEGPTVIHQAGFEPPAVPAPGLGRAPSGAVRRLKTGSLPGISDAAPEPVLIPRRRPSERISSGVTALGAGSASRPGSSSLPLLDSGSLPVIGSDSIPTLPEESMGPLVVRDPAPIFKWVGVVVIVLMFAVAGVGAYFLYLRDRPPARATTKPAPPLGAPPSSGR
ncbi:MAG: serine/threonine protein kinase [Deltaproteobacteria bacterium]|nr:serine/threonine protein kinase [Deltaproteobacteria bacterium]